MTDFTIEQWALVIALAFIVLALVSGLLDRAMDGESEISEIARGARYMRGCGK